MRIFLTLAMNILNNLKIFFHFQMNSKEVLKLSHGLDEITWFNWKLAACLFLAWSFVFLSIVKGVQSLGKVIKEKHRKK